MANRLSHEKSPYLLQHAENPVDWYPWGEEAFAKAAREDRPIFLSIGYSSCHWCHVMARESFSDAEVAEILNGNFVAVKVDREERPDVDSLYMTACQTLTGQGGWPLSVFLTPDKRPFFAGTYFPKRARGAAPGFIEVLGAITRLWEHDRTGVDNAGDQITRLIRDYVSSAGEAVPLGAETIDRAMRSLLREYDEENGGFGDAPKFPIAHRLSLLLRHYHRTGDTRAREAATSSLSAMRRGGIFDQLGFGFHRYAVDRRWRVPHFEKMLVDQALMAAVNIEAFLATREAAFARTAREVFAYVLRDMTSTEGAFYTAEDAESGSEEGAFYLFTLPEIEDVLGKADTRFIADYFGITGRGNVPVPGFADGHNILFLPVPPERFARDRGMTESELFEIMEPMRERLLAYRKTRPRPRKDDKVITAANGLMIGALALGYRALGEPFLLEAAARAADFILGALSDGDGGLLRRYRDGEAAIPGFLMDYAFFVSGLIDLYEAGFEARYLREAQRLARVMIERFYDEREGGFFTAPRGSAGLIADLKEIYDGAVPSGNSVAAEDMLRLSGLLGDVDLSRTAERLMEGFSGRIAAQPQAHARMLVVLDLLVNPTTEIVIVGRRGSADTTRMIRAVHDLFLPGASLLFVPDGDEKERRMIEEIAPFTGGMRMQNSMTTAYVCRGNVCGEPFTDPSMLSGALSQGSPGTEGN